MSDRGIRIVEPPETKEFDPSNPHDAMCESFRRQMTEMVLAAERVTIYREMPSDKQLSSFIIGSLAGVVGVAFASIRKEGHDQIMDTIAASLPLIRKQVEDIIANSRGNS